jgi:hypothetical protein
MEGLQFKLTPNISRKLSVLDETAIINAGFFLRCCHNIIMCLVLFLIALAITPTFYAWLREIAIYYGLTRKSGNQSTVNCVSRFSSLH